MDETDNALHAPPRTEEQSQGCRQEDDETQLTLPVELPVVKNFIPNANPFAGWQLFEASCEPCYEKGYAATRVCIGITVDCPHPSGPLAKEYYIRIGTNVLKPCRDTFRGKYLIRVFGLFPKADPLCGKHSACTVSLQASKDPSENTTFRIGALELAMSSEGWKWMIVSPALAVQYDLTRSTKLDNSLTIPSRDIRSDVKNIANVAAQSMTRTGLSSDLVSSWSIVTSRFEHQVIEVGIRCPSIEPSFAELLYFQIRAPQHSLVDYEENAGEVTAQIRTCHNFVGWGYSFQLDTSRGIFDGRFWIKDVQVELLHRDRERTSTFPIGTLLYDNKVHWWMWKQGG